MLSLMAVSAASKLDCADRLLVSAAMADALAASLCDDAVLADESEAAALV